MSALLRTVSLSTVLSLAVAVSGCGHHRTARPATLHPVVPSSFEPSTPASSAGPAPAGPSGSTGAPTTNPPIAVNAIGRCAGNALRAEFHVTSTESGRRSGMVGLRNVASTACTLAGYPGLQLVGRGVGPVSTDTAPDGKPGRTVRLDPGKAAWTTLTWTTVAAADEPRSGPCEPEAPRLAVNPPDDDTQLFAAFAAGPVCDHGRMTMSALTGPG
jgi:hypothetical protein